MDAVRDDHGLRLLEVRLVFEAFQAEIDAHTKDEDKGVFPAIRKLNSGEQTHLEAASAKLESEHEYALAVLARFKERADNYITPEWACNTFRALYDGLANLKSTRINMCTKKKVLFPRARALK